MRYSLPPGDPRVDALTEEEIAEDLELGYAVQENAELEQCDQCRGWTYRPYCPRCPGSPPLNAAARLREAEERGQYVDWDAFFKKAWANIDAN